LETYGEWAEAEVQLFSQIIRPTDTVVEVGANIGSHTLAMARLASEGRVHAFEPQPYVFSLLQKNILDNGLKNITLWNVAVGSEVGRVSMPYLSANIYSPINFGAISIHTVASRRVGVPLLKMVLPGILWLDGECHENTSGWKHTIKFSANTTKECLDLPKVGRFPGWICDWKTSAWNCVWVGRGAGRFARNVARA
jgi:FkbM family methyltransferase